MMRPGLAPCQRGASLIVALIFLVVLTLLGLSMMRATTLEVRIVGLEQDRKLAFEAAEAALRDGERDLNANGITPESAFVADCTGGLCRPSTVATPQWHAITWTNADSRTYGSATGAGAYTGPVSSAPRYILEVLPNLPAPAGSTIVANSRASSDGGTAYRITAIGWGRRAETRVMLQSVYIRP